ncbi:MAG: galactokinase [Pirellulales bacterium]
MIDDFQQHLARLRAVPDLFEPGRPILVARAPGRLDVMGGIADYSGSLVLEMPIAEAAFVAVQSADDSGVTIVSLPQQPGESARRVVFSGDDWKQLIRGDYEAARRRLHEDPAASWTAYILGPALVLMRESSARLAGGLRILVDSRVPEGKGVSSSAAVEVATMRAVAALANYDDLTGSELGRLCQVAENRVVGAPCGIMDQMTSALGREHELLALLCQPATVEGFVSVPKGIAFWGVDSGIRHAVSGSDYSSVRCGAFMGYRILAELAALAANPSGDDSNRVVVEDTKWNGYLANVTPAEFRERFADAMPAEMSGREFLARYGGTTDAVTHVDPARTYAVREPAYHPIGENARVRRFRELLQAEITEAALREMGELMFAAHASYSACGIGSDGTDLLVQLVREAGSASGLYGAKITGGGSGGTVAILGRADAGADVDRIAAEYTRRSGRETYIFRGSSPGAWATPVQKVTT